MPAPPLVIPPGLAECSLNFTSPDFFSGKASVTFGVDVGLTDLPTQAGIIATQWISDIWTPHGLDAFTFDSIVLRTATTTFENPVGAPGGTTGTPALPNACLLVKKATALNGKAHRGRMYVPGLLKIDTASTAGVIGSTTLATFQAAFSTFRDGLAGSAVPMEVLHHSAVAPDDVTFLLVRDRVATQRRRLRN